MGHSNRTIVAQPKPILLNRLHEAKFFPIT